MCIDVRQDELVTFGINCILNLVPWRSLTGAKYRYVPRIYWPLYIRTNINPTKAIKVYVVWLCGRLNLLLKSELLLQIYEKIKKGLQSVLLCYEFSLPLLDVSIMEYSRLLKCETISMIYA